MATAEKITALRGMRDVFSAEYARRRAIQDTLEGHLRLHSYVPIDMPILENTELYLRKSGEDIAARLYEFNFKNRRIALRPEVTASILRAYVENLQDEPLPLRIQYGGPVFRYEKPQQHRYRQFTMAGAELLGASGPKADAELIHLACSGLQELGIRDYRLVIGITDVLEGFLRKLGLRKQLLNFLLRNMENLRKRGLTDVLESLRAIYPEFELEGGDLSGASGSEAENSQQLISVLREMSDGEAHQAITDFLHSLNIRIDTNRVEGEVIDRLLHKIREDEQSPKLRAALTYMQRLSELSGAPAAVLPGTRALVADFDLDPGALSSLEGTLAALADHGDLDGTIEIDFGLNRGLHYYTGLMFEIYCKTSDGEEIQVCGGGRYDQLISILGGGGETGAAGFAWGIERIASVRHDEPGATLNVPDVYLIPVADDDFAVSNQVAKAIRARGFIVEVSIDERSLRRRLKHADRRRVSFVIMIGASERERGQAILRDMRVHQEQKVDLDALPALIEELLTADG